MYAHLPLLLTHVIPRMFFSLHSAVWPLGGKYENMSEHLEPSPGALAAIVEWYVTMLTAMLKANVDYQS